MLANPIRWTATDPLAITAGISGVLIPGARPSMKTWIWAALSENCKMYHNHHGPVGKLVSKQESKYGKRRVLNFALCNFVKVLQVH